MPRPLAVALPHRAGWARTALEQSGVPFVTVDGLRDGLERGLRCFVWSGTDPLLRDPPPEAGEPLVVITDHATLAGLEGQPFEPARSARFRFEPAPSGERSFRIEADAATLGASPTNGCCEDAEGRVLPGSGILRRSRGAVRLVSLPWDVTGLELGTGSGYRAHGSKSSGRHFVEVGPPFDSGALRRLLFEIVRGGFGELGLPLVRLSPQLEGRRQFGVRIDADGYSRESTDAVLRIARSIGASFTWFIDVESWQGRLDEVRRLAEAGQDVQLHCWRHLTYRSRRTNAANLRAGRRALARRGVRVEAVVSPLGFCFPGFADAVRDLGLRYSSEFGAAVDDLPFRPGNDSGRPLQVPVHPGSVGVLELAQLSPDEMRTHLETAVLEQSDGDGMGILYDHPLGRLERHEELFTTMLRSWIDRGYAYLGMGPYAAAWAARPPGFGASVEDGGIRLEGDPDGAGFGYEIYQPPGVGPFRPEGFRPRTGTVDGRIDRYTLPPQAVCETVAERDAKYAGRVGRSVAAWHATNIALRARRGLLATRRRLLRAAGRRSAL